MRVVVELEELITRHINPDEPVHSDDFKALVFELFRTESDPSRPYRVLEVGGGRTPLLRPDEIDAKRWSYWVADISAEELDHLPGEQGEFNAACFDVAGAELKDIPVPLHSFDLVFSRSLFEHVADTDLALRNCRSLLAPGGVMIHGFPTLWNPVFVANKVLPDAVSDKLLKQVVDYHYEKFPARYHRTTSGRSQTRRLRLLGLDDVVVAPFWGHGYLHFVPRVQRVEAAFARLARRRDWRWYSTFCFIAGRAPLTTIESNPR